MKHPLRFKKYKTYIAKQCFSVREKHNLKVAKALANRRKLEKK